MKTRANPQWDPLAAGVVATRAELRRLMVQIDQAAATGVVPAETLLEWRDLAAALSSRLTSALKHPTGNGPDSV